MSSRPSASALGSSNLRLQPDERFRHLPRARAIPPGCQADIIDRKCVAAKPETDAPPLSYFASEFKQILPIRTAKVSERPQRASRSAANSTPDQRRRRCTLRIIENYAHRIANVAHKSKFRTGIHRSLVPHQNKAAKRRNVRRLRRGGPGG
jgi:hypothetical protein